MGTETKAATPVANILLIEDDDALRRLGVSILTQANYRVLAAVDGNEAAEIVSREQDSIDLLIADILLPGLSGSEVARELVEQRPDLRVILVSGTEEPVVLETLALVKNVRFLRKPYSREQLLTTIREALAQ